MAEPRRIPFDTVKSLAKEKKAKDQPPTQRFSLTLDESNDKTCPEYSYSDLVKTAREDKKEPVQDDNPFGADDDDDNDDKLRELARKFEEKYGPRIGKKKKKKFGKWEDYIDRGMGYDENDSFIDNDEAYDELVPSTLTTQYGGFYINSGGLEFRAVSDSDSEEFNDEHKPRKKRRRLIEKDSRRRRRLLKEGEHIPKKRGRRPLDKSFSALQLSKKKRQPTVAALLQQHKSQLQVEPVVNENSFQSENGEECAEDGVKGDISINEVVESVVKSGEERVNNGNVAMTAGSSDSDEHIRLAIEAINAPKLPDNLSTDLEAMISKLKQIAYVSEEGKCKFFSRDVNNMLLSVELKSRELPCSQRSMIYSHLASHLPCTKETLLKRAKKLRMDQEVEKLREPLNRLKEAIGKILPGLLDKYVADCKIIETKMENEREKKSDENSPNDKEKCAKFPQKEFQWNDEIRKLLCDLVRTKVRWYETSKVRNQSAEEYIWQFLELEVKNLWPAGWMKTKHLYKESREAHGYLTNKPKKPILVQRKPGIPLGIQVPVVPASRLSSGVVLSPIATGQELAEGISNIKVPTTSADDGESLGTLIAVTTANSALSEEQKPHILTEVSSVLPSRTLSVVSSSVPVQQSDKEANASIVSAKSTISPEIKTTGQVVPEKPSISLSQIGSPSKRIFTLINSGDAAQLQAQQASQQTSLASQMLDRIICASLANFPNSGSSTSEPGRYKPLNIGRDLNIAEQNVRPSPKSALEVSQPKLDCLSVKPPSPAKVDSQVGSPSTLIRSSSIGVSILKSSYQAPTEQRQIHGRTLSLPEQTKGLTSTLVGTTTVTSRKFQSTPVVTNSNTINSRKNEELKMPFHSYEFLEAFKRTLESSPEPLQPRSESSVVLTSSKVKNTLTENARELCDEPMNFKKLQSPVDSVSSLIPQDFSSKQDNPTVVHLSSTYKRPNQQVRSMQLTNSLRAQRSSPETVSTPVSFPEGMKGFPLPIKSQSTNPSCLSSLSTTNPAHGLVSRTSPAQAHEPGFTSPHRHNSPSPHRSVSAHSPSHGHPSSTGNNASHNPYQSTPLSHYSPVEAAHNRTMLQNQWRANSPSATTNFSSQYSASSTSPNTSSPTSQTYQNPSQNPSSHHHHHHNTLRAQGSSVPQVSSYSQTSHNISQQVTPAHNASHKTVDSHAYSQQSGILPSRHSMNSVWQQNPNRTPSNTQPFPNSAIVGPQGNEYPGQRSTQQTSHHRVP